MELLYYWVDSELTFKNAGFHFSNRYKFKVEINEKNKTCQISAEKNTDYIPSFYGQYVSGLTVVVGENGTGKTNLFYSVISWLTGHGKDPVQKIIFCFYEKEKIKLVHSFASIYANWTLEIEEKSKDLFRETVTSLSKSKNSVGKVVDDCYSPENTTAIYFNPIYDFRYYPFNLIDKPFVDISSTYLLWFDKVDRSLEDFDMVANHKFQEIMRQCMVINSSLLDNNKIGNDINIPTFIDVKFLKETTIEKGDLGYKAIQSYEWLRKNGSSVLHGHNEVIEGYEKNSEKRVTALLEKSKTWFLVNLIDNFFGSVARKKELRDEKYDLDISKLESFTKNSFIYKSEAHKDDWPRLDVKEYRSAVLEFFEIQNFVDKNFFSIAKFINSIFKLIDENAVKNNLIFQSFSNEGEFSFQVDKVKDIIELHTSYVGSLRDDHNKGFLQTTWRNMSSGEMAMLNLFARIYFGINQLKFNQQEQDSRTDVIYLFLDEGEHSFHPHWQKRYINLLLEFLKEFEGLKFQLFLSSHSPIILSDVLKENAIFLEKIEPGQSQISNDPDRSQTFGSNIHSLYRDSFFIKDGLIGDFSANEIEKLFNEIERSDIGDNYPSLLKRIELIGEPILRNKLKENLSLRLPNQLRREYLEEELRKLDEDQPENKNI